jgi:hypothetical protein
LFISVSTSGIVSQSSYALSTVSTLNPLIEIINNLRLSERTGFIKLIVLRGRIVSLATFNEAFSIKLYLFANNIANNIANNMQSQKRN